MTTETVTTAWVLVIGSLLILAGAAIIEYVTSARAERRANQGRREVLIRRISEAAVVTPKNADGIDQLLLELLTTPRVPAQRTGDQS